MDVMTALAQIPGIGPYLPYVAVAVALSAALATALPPPPASGGFLAALYGALYHTVSWLALNKGQATNANAPGAAKPPSGAMNALGPIAFLLSAGLVLAACSSRQLSTDSAIATGLAPVAGQIAVDKATQPQLAELQGVCDKNDAAMADANMVLGGGAAQTAAKVDAPLDAFCAVVKQGKVPANADANSVPWAQTAIIAAVKTIIALASG